MFSCSHKSLLPAYTTQHFHLCPSPSQGEVILASTRMPTWPCPDLQLLALEALGRVCNLPLRLGNLSELTYASLLRASGPFVANRPPICDGAGAPSSADHSLPHHSGLSSASQAWLKWAQKSDLSKRVFAHISQSRPDHPLSKEEQSEALAILCSALDLDHDSMAAISPGQPFRLQLMQTFSQRIGDPDADLPSMLAEGVHTGVFSEIQRSGLWPPAKLQPLAQSGLEVCQGNWRPAEEEPDTVAALLADEEAAGWIQQVPGGLKAAKKRWPKGIAVGKLSLVKAEGRDPRLVLDSTICQVNPLCRIPEAVTMPTVQDSLRILGEPTSQPRLILRQPIKESKSTTQNRAYCFLPLTVPCGGTLFATSEPNSQPIGGNALEASLPELHASLAQHPHRAWLYVDDLLAALLRTSAHESLLILVLLLSSLGAPISWKNGLCGRQPHLVRMEVQLCL